MKKPFAGTSSGQLPSSRPGLLKDTLRYRFFDIVAVSMLTAVFGIPAVMWLIFASYSDLFGGLDNIYVLAVVYGTLIPLIMIFGLGVSGALYFAKRLAFGEGANARIHFFEGIEKNWKPFLLVFFIVGLAYFLLRVGTGILANIDGISELLLGFSVGMIYAFFFLLLYASYFVETQIMLYHASASQLLGNAAKFVFAGGIKGLGVFALVTLPLFLYEFVPSSLAQWIIILVCGLFYFGFSFFGFTLYSHSIFDQAINIKSYPEIYHKGLAGQKEKTSGDIIDSPDIKNNNDKENAAGESDDSLPIV